MTSSLKSIRVYTRFKPLDGNGKNCGISLDQENGTVRVPSRQTGGNNQAEAWDHSFDGLLTDTASQEDVFRTTTAPLVDALIGSKAPQCRMHSRAHARAHAQHTTHHHPSQKYPSPPAPGPRPQLNHPSQKGTMAPSWRTVKRAPVKLTPCLVLGVNTTNAASPHARCPPYSGDCRSEASGMRSRASNPHPTSHLRTYAHCLFHRTQRRDCSYVHARNTQRHHD